MVVWIYCWQIVDRDTRVRQQPNVARNRCIEPATPVELTGIGTAQLHVNAVMLLYRISPLLEDAGAMLLE
jgi:hypothetical protein